MCANCGYCKKRTLDLILGIFFPVTRFVSFLVDCGECFFFVVNLDNIKIRNLFICCDTKMKEKKIHK